MPWKVDPRTKQQHTDRRRRSRQKNPAAYNAYNRRYRQANSEQFRAYEQRRWKMNRGNVRARGRERKAAVRAEMIAAYGSRCACCGESQPGFLTIEHTNRDGGAHRKAKGGNYGVWADLKKRDWPKDGYELRCMNCNWATRFGRPCPHDERRGLRLIQGCRR